MAYGSSYSRPSTSLADAAGHRPCSGTRTEQFVHITGEVTDPAPLEKIVVEHPMVHSAVIFGHGRYNAGILVELEDDYKINASDAKQVEETRNKLQPAFDRMNMLAPQHARIQKEMVLFATPTKPIVNNPCNAARANRQDTLAKYSDEINILYKTIARAARMSLKPPKVWSPENSLNYVRGIVIAVLDTRLSDDADLFDHGADSLQATRIRIKLFHALQSTAKLDTRKFSGDIVHQYRTVAGIATFATRAALACFRHRTESNLARCLEMRDTAQSYSVDFPTHRPSLSPPFDDVVLITGTTGLIGSNLLVQFLRCPRVSRVYALNSKKSRPGSALDRQAALLQASGLDPTLARHPKLIFIEADARQSRLGLYQELYTQLLSSVTHIVHNAWLSANHDNLPLNVFEGSFRMLRNVVDFALSSPLPTPPRLLFVSSIDTLQGTSQSILNSISERERRKTPLAPEGPVNACDAAGGAFGESKWVGEQILTAAASRTPLRPIIIRVGPLCGAANGRWRQEAHFPMIVQLGVALGALPKVNEIVDWVPVHTAAQAVAEMRNASSTFLHITHPHPVSSHSLLHFLSGELHLPLIALSQWISKLEDMVHTRPALTSRVRLDDSALTLLRHIQRTRDPTATVDVPARMFQHVRITSDDAWFVSPTLHSSVDALGIADVQLWLRHWQETGMIPRSEP